MFAPGRPTVTLVQRDTTGRGKPDTAHVVANQISKAEARAYRGKKLLVDKHFLAPAGRITVGPFLLGPGSYTLRFTATDAYGRTRTLTWIVALAR